MKRLFHFVLAAVLLTACSGNSVPTWKEQYDLGVRCLSEGKYEEAILAFTAAIEIDPKRTPAYEKRGDAYVGYAQLLMEDEPAGAALSDKALDAYENAVEDYLTAIGLDDSDASVYRKAAEVYVALGDTESAAEILMKGVQETGKKSLQTALDELKGTEAEEPENVDLDAMNEAAHGAYQVVLDKYRDVIFMDYETFLADWQSCCEDILDESKMTDHRYYEHESGEGFIAGYYYCFMDLDRNGVDELLIGYGYGGTEPYEIVDVRYFNGEAAQSVVEKLSGTTYYYLFGVYEDGTVEYSIGFWVYEGAPHTLAGLVAFDETGTDVRTVFEYEQAGIGSYSNGSETLSPAELRALLNSHLPKVETFDWRPIDSVGL